MDILNFQVFNLFSPKEPFNLENLTIHVDRQQDIAIVNVEGDIPMESWVTEFRKSFGDNFVVEERSITLKDYSKHYMTSLI